MIYKQRCKKCNRNLKLRAFSISGERCNSCVARSERQAAYMTGLLEKLPFCNDENWKHYTHSYPHFLALLELRKQLSHHGSISATAGVLKVNAGTIHKAIFSNYVSPKLFFRLGIKDDVSLDALLKENLSLNRDIGNRIEAVNDLICPICNEIHTVDFCTNETPAVKGRKPAEKTRVRIAADVSIEQREALHSKAAAIGVSFSELLRAVADDEIELVVLPGFRHYGRLLIEGVDYIDSDFATED